MNLSTGNASLNTSLSTKTETKKDERIPRQTHKEEGKENAECPEGDIETHFFFYTGMHAICHANRVNDLYGKVDES